MNYNEVVKMGRDDFEYEKIKELSGRVKISLEEIKDLKLQIKRSAHELKGILIRKQAGSFKHGRISLKEINKILFWGGRYEYN